MMSELPLILKIGVGFAYLGGIAFFAIGIWLSWQRGRLHPLLLVSISALSFSWIEAPYDWAVYAQFPPELPRMPSWWPLNMTWGGLPSAVPPGYIAYFILPTVIAAYLGHRISGSLSWRLPGTLLLVGFVLGTLWAFVFNAGFGARLGVFYYGYVIEGLAFWPGTKHQYPWYDSIAMGVQVMAFTYLLGRTDFQGRTIVEVWADSKTQSRLRASLLSIAAFIAIGHAVYLSVFAPHLATKLMGLVTVGPSEQLFPGVPNQPL
ncbi:MULTISPECIES: spirocyclase AveC family protein [unclassified Ketobacter]|uniref:spirocyclase AveC family protein n=1 Tax=unclassified Ketobacter TaxID=2639109 RepID=UPI000F0FD5B8|nr:MULTISPECIES: spirocyclase AveC family protein [unclassified Ketobacter]RLT91255.1 MAG: spirocyclase, AveC family [Ketobacter sp. GenoA1]RLT98310.1 MAG: spirocyclase, AveC family [Ketobacter sp.]